MPPARRPVSAPAAAPVAVEYETLNFGDASAYSQSFTLPEGDWCLFFAVKMSDFTKKDGTKSEFSTVGIELEAYNLNAPTEEARTQFLGMGKDAKLSWMPHPETGKSLVKVPGGPGALLSPNTNWDLFLQSLKNSGLPSGIFSNDISPIDGIWVHTQQQDEPEARKNYKPRGARTGAAAMQAAMAEASGMPVPEEAEERRMGSGKIVVVTEIKEGGKPWEGTGGWPPAAQPIAPAPGTRPVAARPVAAPVPAARPAPMAAPRPAAAAPTGNGHAEMDVATAAQNGVAAVLGIESNLRGIQKIKLRMGTFEAISAATGDPTLAQSVLDAYFRSDETLNVVLGPLGYVASGANVVPQA